MRGRHRGLTPPKRHMSWVWLYVLTLFGASIWTVVARSGWLAGLLHAGAAIGFGYALHWAQHDKEDRDAKQG